MTLSKNPLITAILVDDEPAALKALQWEIEHFCSNVEVIGSFSSPAKAIIAINQQKPDCVLLDIEMPEMDAFNLLSKLKFRKFELIFTTAYQEYALQAFHEEAIAYLLKPVDADHLVKSLEKVKERKISKILGKNIESLFFSIANKIDTNKITLRQAGKVSLVTKDEILYCEAFKNYCTVFLIDQRKITLSKSMKSISQIIDMNYFVRVHQSYIVNPTYIVEYNKMDGHHLILSTGKRIPVSRSYRKHVEAFFGI